MIDTVHVRETYSDSTSLLVVDPMTHKLRIPMTAVLQTRALTRVGVPSLCMLYMSGRCRQGPQCHQAHAVPEVVARLRAEVLLVPLCCPSHGDASTAMTDVSQYSALVVDGLKIPLTHVSPTLGLRNVVQAARGAKALTARSNSVCRLHFASHCRYGDDCKFLHVCRSVLIANSKHLFGQEMNWAEQPPPPFSTTSVPPTTTLLGPPLVRSLLDTSTSSSDSSCGSVVSSPEKSSSFIRSWTHDPYASRVLENYQYLSAPEIDALSEVTL